MNSITDLLDLEDTDIIISDTQIQGQTKTITLGHHRQPIFVLHADSECIPAV